ncbi:hypothetical protein DFS34DRAFT_513037 [Phlyctochytrium arcticum]|nr:hypothetical protein DFS34DRAFT_513037 [Phlyctochytrium arcticum]
MYGIAASSQAFPKYSQPPTSALPMTSLATTTDPMNSRDPIHAYVERQILRRTLTPVKFAIHARCTQSEDAAKKRFLSAVTWFKKTALPLLENDSSRKRQALQGISDLVEQLLEHKFEQDETWQEFWSINRTKRCLRRSGRTQMTFLVEEETRKLVSKKKKRAFDTVVDEQVDETALSAGKRLKDESADARLREPTLAGSFSYSSFDEATSCVETSSGEPANVWVEYKKKIAKMQASHLPLLGQNGRHLQKLSHWFLADATLVDLPPGDRRFRDMVAREPLTSR